MNKEANLSELNAINPQNLKSQLKKLSSTSNTRKPSKTVSVFDTVTITNKPSETKLQAPKAKRLAPEEEQDSLKDSVQGSAEKSKLASFSNPQLTDNQEGAPANAQSITSTPNNVSIASLSISEPTDFDKTSNAYSFSQSDTIVAQAPLTSSATYASASASTPSFSLAGLGAGVGAAVALGGSKGGSASGGATPPTTPATPLALSGFIAAGPVINSGGLKLEAFDANGTLLASTSNIQEDGTFSVTLDKPFAGVIKLVVSDTNGSDVNFMDEASGQAKSLGADPLITIFNVPTGQSKLNLNVNTLTTEAAKNILAHVGDQLTQATGDDISSQNLAVATKYGISDSSSLDEFLTEKPELLIDTNAAINPNFNVYGVALAIKSVLDNNPSMQMKDALKSLADNTLYKDWSEGSGADSFSWNDLIYAFGSKIITNDLPTGALTITDANGQPLNQALATPGQVLTATHTIEDNDGIPTTGIGTLTLHWQTSLNGIDWSDIEGASGPASTFNTFTLTQAQVSKLVRVVATYTDHFGALESINSAPTTTVLPSTQTVTQLGATQSFAAGDLNADGISDWLFTFNGGDPSNGGLVGKAYVMYGNTSADFDLSSPVNNASSANLMFTLDEGMMGTSLLPMYSTNVNMLPIIAGDTNGNGKGEVAFATQRGFSQSNYVDVLEQASLRVLRVISTNTNSAASNYFVGYSTGSSGDINGDGYSDFYLDDCYAPTGQIVYVMFGNKNLTGIQSDIDISSNGNGIQITNSNQDQNVSFGQAVAYLGDSNGDGYGDIAIANSFAANNANHTQEEIFVVFGNAQLRNLDVASIENGQGSSNLGYVIFADPAIPSLASNMGLNANKVAGDFNGDGLNDFLFEGRTYDQTQAKFYVVLGKNDTAPIHLGQLGNQGFTISLPEIALTNVIISPTDNPRDAGTNCGDINGDGVDDILITLAFNTSIAGDTTQKTNHFLAYVVFGKSDLGNIDLNHLGSNGYKLAEYSKILPIGSFFFGNITAPGDINGDGISDLILDDYLGDKGLLPTVLLGSADNPLLPSAQNKFTFQGTTSNDTINLNTSNTSETLVGGAGDDEIYGNGGADVMYGGAGNDVFYLNQDNINQLSLPISSSDRLARIDGGGGIDTLEVTGTNNTLDLTQIADNRLQSIEKINLGTSNTLKVSWKDIQNLSAMNIFNNTTNGWTGFDTDTMPYHQLVIDGQSSDSINLTDGGWVKTSGSSSTLANANQTYDAYLNANHAVQLIINHSINTTIL